MKKTLLSALCASTLGLGACGLEVPDLNNPSLDTFRENPTPSAVFAASTGLVMGSRNGKSAQNGYVAHLGILGRESYTFDAADPRFVTEMLASPSLDPGSPAFGGNLWNQPYANIRNANTLLAAVDKVLDVSEGEKEGIRGFAKTMQALDFLTVVVTRDTNGGPIDVGGDIEPPAPIENREKLLSHVVTLLDEAKTHFEAPDAVLPFPVSTGLQGANRPEDFLKFNRALKARAEVYRQNWAGALQALSESFLTPQTPGGTPDDEVQLSLGDYHVFGKGSGDTTNGLTSPNIFAHPSIVTDAERKPDCTDDPKLPFKCLDNRVKNKIKVVEARTYQGLTSQYMFTLYPDQLTPVPIIRNEDLILLRAEANIQLNNDADAELDINYIRQHAGGLPPVTLTGENATDVLLYERRYSLLFEGGHRWIDMRRYEALDQLPKDKPEHFVHTRFPIPVAETDARQ
ncbi:RagB/SusD family nutrient uptake outer membrane protein [Hyalangium sp.]|uniref:RagB/SusD family nutrient uptake outer membrane protein n=1 Tax=Hyalangium sp. TaxID=2028555 RepID=UPI002D2EBE06|nr:RagB/SusD family nutrient uptake outer membrane protein [Hyalangium sp.]HYI01931.1 RagB/SusD family nutrient uptake outer membrane protein [Hyalangium sp.]